MYFFEFKMPSKIMCVDGGAGRLGKTVDRLGAERVLVVTDEGVRKAGLVEPVMEGMEKAAASVITVFDGVRSDPDVASIEECADVAEEYDVDGFITVGGGSAIDTTKGAIIRLCEDGDLLDFEWDEYFASRPVPPHVAVPTTAGTGSEATHVTMITDVARSRKMMYSGGDLIPAVAVLDPRMTVGLPPRITASTGMDALTHAVEAMHSLWHQPMTDGLALQAIGLVAENLERCCGHGDDLSARMGMLLAADMGGIAAANAFIGIVHATAHPLGGLFHVPHGDAVAVTLPYCMEFNLRFDGIPSTYRRVASALGLEVERNDDLTAAKRAIERIRELTAGIGLPGRISELGVRRDDLERYIDEVMEDHAMKVTPGMPLTREQVADLVEAAF